MTDGEYCERFETGNETGVYNWGWKLVEDAGRQSWWLKRSDVDGGSQKTKGGCRIRCGGRGRRPKVEFLATVSQDDS